MTPSTPRAHAAVLASNLAELHDAWHYWRARFRLHSLPLEPPPMRLLRRRAMLQAMEDTDRGYRVLPAVRLLSGGGFHGT